MQIQSTRCTHAQKRHKAEEVPNLSVWSNSGHFTKVWPPGAHDQSGAKALCYAGVAVRPQNILGRPSRDGHLKLPSLKHQLYHHPALG